MYSAWGFRSVILRPASHTALKTVVATCEVPPPISSSYSVPMITGADQALGGPLSDRRVERERAAGRDDRSVEQRHAQTQVRDAVRRAGVVGLVRAQRVLDAHRPRLGGRALGSRLDDGEPRDPARRRHRSAEQRTPWPGCRAPSPPAQESPGRCRPRPRTRRRPAACRPSRRASGSTRPPAAPRSRGACLRRVAASSSAMRVRVRRQLRLSPRETRPGHGNASSATGRNEHLRGHGGRRRAYGKHGGRLGSFDRAECSDERLGRGPLLEALSRALRHDDDAQSTADDRCAPRPRSTSSEIWSSAYSSAAFETATGGSTSARRSACGAGGIP